jgi:ABC-type lipoprotein export system ATPase subunit
MIKLKNINKVYVSKSKQKVNALKNINLEIGDKGLVFILGKSGSGKSTLLNIFGGLDSATSGEVFVDNTSFASFKQSDFDSYRNQYVGFVFQEFNLLNDFDVSGNVCLALQLSKEVNIPDKVTKALQAVELTTDYLTRKIDELSGGEKQRIAIARAIVKDSQMILADEPTGNLDSVTSASIWNILKELSKSRLVIVVTHDRESAEKYGDRIIEIADGQIIADNWKQPISSSEKLPFKPQKQRLLNKVVLKMGSNNLLQRKVKAISVILLSIFTIFALMLTQLTLTFSAEKSIAKFIRDNDIDYITLTQGKLRYGNEFDPYQILKPSTLNYISDNTAYIQNECIEKKQDVLDMGLNFIGDALEIDDNSYYLTTSGLKEAYESRYSFVEIDGTQVKLVKEQHPIEFIVGKKVDIGTFDSMEYTLAGVVDISSCNPLISDIFPDYFSKENFGERRVYPLAQNQHPGYSEVIMQFGEVKYTKPFESEKSPSALIYTSGEDSGKILTEHGLQTGSDVELADDEIVLTYELYAELFSVSPKWSYISTDLTEVISTPEHIGQSFDLKFFDYETRELFVDVGSLTIVGIAFSSTTSEDPNDMLKFATSQNINKKIAIALDHYNYILVHVSSIDNLEKFLVNFRQKHEGYILHIGGDKSTEYSNVIYGFEQELWIFKFIFSAIAIILSIILLLVVINLISFSITNRKKEIGILSALGTGSKDIMKMFIIETMIISCLTFIVNLVLIIIITISFNNFFSSFFLLYVPLLRVDIYAIVTLVLTSFGLLLIAALIPIRKIIKLKPIDAIKNL